MAFNKTENQAIIQTGLGNESRGVDANTAYGQLFEGIGKTLTNTLNAYDETTRVDIEVQAGQEVEDAVNASMPPALAEGQRDLQQLASARKQGALTEVEFQTRIANKAKKLRASVPEGYGPMVDKALSSALGTSTANDLRKARLAAIDAEIDATDASAKERRTFLNSNMEFLKNPDVEVSYKNRTGQDLEQGVASGDYNHAALQLSIAAVKARDYEVESQKKRIELDKAAAEPMAREVTMKAVRSVFNKEVNKPFAQFIDAQAKAGAAEGPGGKDWTPEEIKQVTEIWATTKLSAQRTTMDLLVSPEFKNLDDPARDGIKKMVNDYIEIYETALTEKNFGKMTAMARESAAILESDKTNLLRISPEARRSQLGSSLGLPEKVIEDVFIKNGAARDRLSNDLSRIITQETLVGDMSIDKLWDEAAKDTKNMAPVVRATVENLRTILNNPEISEEQLPAIAVRLFREQNNNVLNRLAQKDRINTFRSLITPRVVEGLKKDPEAFKAMSAWATIQFDAISKGARDTILDSQQNRTFMDITFDGKQFVVAPRTPGAVETLTSLPSVPGWEATQSGNASAAVSEINQYLSTMEPIWKEQGLDTKTAVGMLFEYDINKVEKNPTLLQSMGRAIGKFFMGEEKPEKKSGDLKGSAGTDRLEGGPVGDPERQLLGFLSEAEGADYQTMYGGSKAELEAMTVSEVLAFNKRHGRKTGSSATGAYQIMHDTLRDLVAAGVVDEDEMFTQEVQDRAAIALLNRRGYQKFKKGKLSADAFANNLAKEWASLPTSSGKSYYDGDKIGNKSTRRRDQLMAVINSL